MPSRLTQRHARAALMSSLLLAACATESPVSPEQAVQVRSIPQFVQSTERPDRYLVSFKSSEPGDFAAQVAALGGKVERRLGDLQMAVVQGVGVAGATAISRKSGIETVAQDLTVNFVPTPDPSRFRVREATAGLVRPPGTSQSGAFFFADQWNMRQVKADKAWAKSTGGRGALVCILDTGIDPDHIDLAGKVDPALFKSFISAPIFLGDLDPYDYNFHGTASAGYISTNGLGMASVAPDARLCSAKVLNVLGNGSFADIIAGIEWATAVNADVINMSLGGTVDLTIPGARDLVKLMQKAVLRANLKGSVVVASAGNDAVNMDKDPPNELILPAQLVGVISVGATAPFNQLNFDGLASYSNYGGVTGVDLMAPGGDFVSGNPADFVLSTCSQYQLLLPFACSALSYVGVAGTSESAPHVSGAAAVMRAQFPRLSFPLLVDICLQRSADNIGNRKIFGSGRLNVLDAVGCKS
ncbi:MAG TPA: S8 family serine peptidase [Gemmatimonadales bacterium]|nr:S8 family serine peptidase [Gemmatimonadales bacterium]